MANADIQNITCAAFAALSEAEQRAFVIGVANGRGMTAGLFEAYAGAAQDFASTQEERDAIAASYQTIQAMVSPLLTIDATSLLNGIRLRVSDRNFEMNLSSTPLHRCMWTPQKRSANIVRNRADRQRRRTRALHLTAAAFRFSRFNVSPAAAAGERGRSAVDGTINPPRRCARVTD